MGMFNFTEVKLEFSESEIIEILKSNGYKILKVYSNEDDDLSLAFPGDITPRYTAEDYGELTTSHIASLPEYINNVFRALVRA